MTGDLINLQLGEVCDVKQGRYLGPGDMSQIKTDQTPIPVVGANGILGYTDKATYNEDVTLVTCRGSNCGMLQRTNGPTWISNNAMACVPKVGIDSRYIYYVLKATNFEDIITGSAQPQITTGHLNSKVVTINRDLVEQKRIAGILGALDDKIELNRKMNKTLEEMARALFKSWFVDFDPVHAKAVGRQPIGMDKATADLFPDGFEDSELGKIPKGWGLSTLGDILELRNERVEPSPAKDGKRYIALEDMPSRSLDISRFQLGDAVSSSIIKFYEGDILFGSMRPYFHKVGLAFFDGITRTTTFVLCPKRVHMRHFALLHASSDELIDYAKINSVGTTIPYVKWESLAQYRITMPSDELIARFDKHVGSLIWRIGNNGGESRALAAIRDALIPGLLTGEYHV